MTPLPEEQRYTYADLLEWDDDVRYELYFGVPMARMPLSLSVFWTIARLICVPYSHKHKKGGSDCSRSFCFATERCHSVSRFLSGLTCAG